MNTSKSLDEILGEYGAMRALAYRQHGDTEAYSKEAEKLKAGTAAAIVEAVEGLIPKVSDLDSPLQQSWKLGGTDEESFRRGYLQAVTSIRQAIKEWQDYGDSK